MTKKTYKITFQPQQRSCEVLESTKIIEAAAIAGLNVNIPCGGKGTCGKCRVRVLSGEAAATEADRAFFDEKELGEGWRLACQQEIGENLEIEVPASSLLIEKHKILTDSDSNQQHEITPAIRKQFVTLDEPALSDCKSDIERLGDAVGGCKTSLNVLQELPQLLRKNGFSGTAVLSDHRLIDFEAGDTTEHCYGVAMDIGTTTVVGTLLDLAEGKELAIASRMNPQVAYGDDVLSRINYCSQDKENLEKLHGSIIECINDIVGELCESAKIAGDHIYEICVAGNTTMEHILLGIDPKPLGEVPFVSAFSRGLMIDAAKLGIEINANGKLCVFPVIGGFVGGDTSACVLSSKVFDDKEPCLLVDIGTNGEIVLVNDGKMWAASTAAGPALEGARISCGMRATTGAIEQIIFNDDVEFSVLHQKQAVGLCGSGLVDLIAELLRYGIINETGQMISADEAGEDLPAAIKRRIIEDSSGQSAFFIADGVDGQPIVLTQKDVREMQLAVGAIRAGINIMLKKAGLGLEEVGKILLAGGFGNYIRPENAKRIGLLPPQSDKETISYIGNASLAGAKWALLSVDARKKAEELAGEIEHVELSLDMDFQMEFASAMIFPAE